VQTSAVRGGHLTNERLHGLAEGALVRIWRALQQPGLPKIKRPDAMLPPRRPHFPDPELIITTEGRLRRLLIRGALDSTNRPTFGFGPLAELADRRSLGFAGHAAGAPRRRLGRHIVLPQRLGETPAPGVQVRLLRVQPPAVEVGGSHRQVDGDEAVALVEEEDAKALPGGPDHHRAQMRDHRGPTLRRRSGRVRMRSASSWATLMRQAAATPAVRARSAAGAPISSGVEPKVASRAGASGSARSHNSSRHS